MTPGEAMMLARKRAKLGQSVIAIAWGVSTAYVSSIETGKRRFPAGRISELPDDIRRAVTDSLIEGHERSIEELRGTA